MLALNGNAIAGSVDGGVAIGTNAIGIGNGANANSPVTGAVAIAVGNGAVAFGRDTVSGGYLALGEGATVNNARGGGLAIGRASATGIGAIAVGFAGSFNAQTRASAVDSMAIGNGSTASAQGAFALGVATSATNTYATALGANATASGVDSFANGRNAFAVSTDTVAIGRAAVAGATTVGTGAVAIGGTSNATGLNAVALGLAGSASAQGAVALGGQTSAAHANAVALGTGSITADAVGTASATIAGATYAYAGAIPGSTVSVGTSTAQRTLTNVAAGRVVSTSTDAVNGSQLFAAQQAIGVVDARAAALGGTVATGLGGGAAYSSATGVLTSPTYVIGGTSFNSVGAALGNLDGRVATNATNFSTLNTQLNAGTIGIVQQNPGSRVITVGQDSDGARVSLAGTGGNRVLAGLAPGTLAIGSDEAVNGAQLFETNQNVASLTTTVNAVTGGAGVKYFHSNSMAPDALAGGVDSVAVGPSSSASASSAVAIGNSAQANEANSVALGAGSITQAAAGTASTTLAGVNYNYAGSVPIGVVSVGTFGEERTVTNVAAGRVLATSTDAINGSQLFAVHQAVGVLDMRSAMLGGGIAASLGGAAVYDAVTGTLTPPGYAVGGLVVDSVGAALGNLDNRVSGNSTAIVTLSNQVNGAGLGLVQQDIGTRSINVATGTDGARVNFAGTSGDRVLAGVSAGTLAADSNEAVNGAQLYETNQGLAAVANSMAAISGGAGIKYFHNNSTGPDASATGNESISIGASSAAEDANSVAIGTAAHASGDSSIALGAGAEASAADSIAIGAQSVADRANSVSVGSTGAERVVANVAAGSRDTDAANVAQVRAVQTGAVQYDRNTDGSINPTSLTLNPGGSATVIHNVGSGVAPNDAVNVAQLDAMGRDIRGDVWEARREARGGNASAMAMVGMPQAYVPGRSMLAMGLGGYQGEVGIAVGLSGITQDGRWVYKAQMSGNTTHDVGLAVGAGIQW